ncbi:O-methyltransferase [Ferrimonas marina]|uniref:Methyltransferase domain-containing protein n=1 Tax=Ferrimonas marina TaxID=299255 RepID=A0A1M5ZQ59_9GAMM|nr:class I SAM-dependent methyltransferase [Ferrimonas marina]SHI26259.1 Methyltransferase domain-containing protein [Ferrimonas marina]
MFWGELKPRDGNDEELARHPAVLSLSKGELYLAACSHILREDYGFVEGTNSDMPRDKQGNPIPKYTYPAIEYLTQFDYRQKRVFEFGSGGSTLFWQARAKAVTSIENNQAWYQKVMADKADNVTLLFAEGARYPQMITQLAEPFDVIVIDGAGHRYDCAQAALPFLADGGMIILDNADWHPNTAALLKQSGLLQVDMTGFKPTEHHTSTTSLFLKRDFDFPTREARQPSFGMGAKQLHSEAWDKPQT